MNQIPPHEWRRIFSTLERARCPRHIWKSVYQEYLRSSAWKEIRAFIVEYYEGRCANCLKEKPLHVHHKTYERLGDEEYADLQPLCEQCHMLEHGLIQHTRWFSELLDKLFGPRLDKAKIPRDTAPIMPTTYTT